MMQYMSNMSPGQRPQQQSSPESQNSMSSATPPNQISRASPASTALVMSQNNISGQVQAASRQLSPNNSSSNNGTGSSSTSSTGGHHHHHHHHNQAGQQQPPNPMIRQFACHAKSMSAGVVVPVPGISNHLAPSTGMNQNNMISNNIVNSNNNQASNHHHHHHHQQQLQQQQQQQNHQQHQPQPQVANHHHRSGSHHHHQQQAPREHHRHHLQLPPQYNSHTSNNHHASQNSGQFMTARQHSTNSSSIILSNNNINNIHNRSASTHLSSMVLNGQQQHRQFPDVATANNAIWSIDENISKSHGKLSSSGYIPHPYLFNHSITDMSCDNVSNASRLIDGAPAPGYYLHAPGKLPQSSALSPSNSIKTPEFLPICDLMFNLISMIIYFCDNTFSIIALIALHYHSATKYWAFVGAAFVFSSNVITQYLSFKWLYKNKLEDCRRKREAQEELEDEEDCERRYYNRMAANMRNYQCGSCTWLPNSATEVQLKFLASIAMDTIAHVFCFGFLMRYIKLVIPVTDTARVKKEARDLSMLRMIHGFVQSAPLLLLQTYMICSQTSSVSVTNLSVTAAILSLVNVCWALASFTKYARKKFMHKFVLTWLGIVSQLLWRLGTISSRVMALTIYAVYYSHWMLAILALHWLTMFLWLMKPGNLLRDEVNLSPGKKVSFAMSAAWVYCFCYVNFEEHNSKIKMVCYYLLMFLENNLLLTVCTIFSSQVNWFRNLSLTVVYLGFAFGILSLIVYYKYFHVTVLNNGLSCSEESIDSIADQLSAAGKKIAGFKPGTLRLKSEDSLTSAHIFNNNIATTLHTGSHPEITRNIKPPYLASSHAPMPQSGVFNCNMNTTASRKQKLQQQQQHQHHHQTARRHNQ